MNRSYKGNNSLLEVGHGETYVEREIIMLDADNQTKQALPIDIRQEEELP
jgi:hypothetical protein